MYANLPHCPDFAELEGLTPIMDLDVENGGSTRTAGGERDVDEFGLKVQKLASVHSVTLFFVRRLSGSTSSHPPSAFTLPNLTHIAKSNHSPKPSPNSDQQYGT